MATPDSDYFHDLPALTSDLVAALPAGHELSLLLLEYVPPSRWDEDTFKKTVGIIFPVHYIHRELIYRTPGEKDAVAFGTAKLLDSGDFRDVRILFSRPNKTATLRGLTLEGPVKAGPNNSFKPTRIVASATCLRYASTRPPPRCGAA